MGENRKFELQYHNGQSTVLEEGTPILNYELRGDPINHIEKAGTSRLTLEIIAYSIAKNMPILKTKSPTSNKVSEIIPLSGLKRIVVLD